METVEAFVVEFLRRFIHLQIEDEHGVLADLREAVRLADTRILAEAERHPELAGMATTLTMTLASGSRLFVIHAGDSHCYLFRGAELHRLTEDHTRVAEMVSRGELSPEQARRHPQRHVITNALGGGGVRVDVQRVALEPGDLVLLCSDGLTDMLDDGTIVGILAAEAGLEGACRRLVAQANEDPDAPLGREQFGLGRGVADHTGRRARVEQVGPPLRHQPGLVPPQDPHVTPEPQAGSRVPQVDPVVPLPRPMPHQ